MSSSSLNDIIVETGAFGWYQKRTLFIISMVGGVLAAMQVTLPIFTAAIPRMECTSDGWEQLHGGDNGTIDSVANSSTGEEESTIIDCNTINVEEHFCELNATLWQIESSSYSSTIGSKWGLYCQDEYKNELLTTVFFIGFLTGNAICGTLADRIGRHKSSLLFTLILCLPGFVAALSQNYEMYMVCRLCTGIGVGGFAIASFVLLQESVGEHYRSICGIVSSVSFSIGLMILPGVAYLCRDWRYLTFISTIPLLPFFFFIQYYMLESPYWLVSKNQIEQANDWVKAVDKINNNKERTDPKKLEIQSSQQQQNGTNDNDDTNHEKSESSKTSPISLLIIPLLRYRLLTMACIWFAVSFSYYGLSFNAGNLGSNLYLSAFLSGLCELPGYIPGQYFLEKSGRKFTLSGCLLLSTLSYILCLTIAHVPLECEGQSSSCWQKTTRLLLSLVGKSTISTAFTIIYIYTAELFPTDIRSLALSVCSQAARLGSMTAPMVLVLSHTEPSLPFVVFGIITAISTILSFCLPETLGQPLPETLDDLMLANNSKSIKQYSKVNKDEEDCNNVIVEMTDLGESSSLDDTNTFTIDDDDDDDDNPSSLED